MATITRPAAAARAPAFPEIRLEHRRAPRPTVAELEQQLLEVEGPFHVAGRYGSDALLVERERHRVAARIRRDYERGLSPEHACRVSEVRRIWNEGSRACGWCDRPIVITDTVYPLGGRLVHDPECLEEYDRWVGSHAREGAC